MNKSDKKIKDACIEHYKILWGKLSPLDTRSDLQTLQVPFQTSES